MREVYAREARDTATPACLREVASPVRPPRRATIGAPPLRPLPRPRHRATPRPPEDECELAQDAALDCDAKLWSGAARGQGTHGSQGSQGSQGPVVRGAEEHAERYAPEPGSEGAGWSAGARAYVTLPRRQRGVAAALFRRTRLPPRRTTADGTDIYYWCDLPPRSIHELDDGAYNPLWAMRGFTQTFHLWKEGKRQQSAPLNAYLTYVTLPWWSIAKDILDHREEPILTF